MLAWRERERESERSGPQLATLAKFNRNKQILKLQDGIIQFALTCSESLV